MTHKDTAAAIRRTLKIEHGWNARQISVRAGGGDAISVTIKDANVDFDVVEAVAASYRRTSVDEATGQALAYGVHTIVLVQWDPALVRSITDRIDLDTVRALPAGKELAVGIVSVRRIGGDWYALEMLDKVAGVVVENKLGRPLGEVSGAETVAQMIAHASLALDGREIDQEAAPVLDGEQVEVYVEEGATIERLDTVTGTSTTIAAPRHGVVMLAERQADDSHRHDGGRYVYTVPAPPPVEIHIAEGVEVTTTGGGTIALAATVFVEARRSGDGTSYTYTVRRRRYTVAAADCTVVSGPRDPMACPGCSHVEGNVDTLDARGVATCCGCGGIFTTRELDPRAEREYISWTWADDDGAGAGAGQYFDLIIAGDEQPRRVHGWRDRQSRQVLQVG